MPHMLHLIVVCNVCQCAHSWFLLKKMVKTNSPGNGIMGLVRGLPIIKHLKGTLYTIRYIKGSGYIVGHNI